MLRFCEIYRSISNRIDNPIGGHELNWRVNAEALLELSNWCEKHNIPLIHFSTDYVFDGENQ
ncbi:MAG: sugar nucleotide-binding protein, partial [Bacteroidota bacterium]